MKLRNNRGFTLLLATLVASLLTALGLAMFTIAQKEVRLSAMSRDSQFAFYAADAGAECALLLHYKYDAFATTTDFTFSSPHNIKCDGQELLQIPYLPVTPKTYLGGHSNTLGSKYETTFLYNLQGASSDYCVSVQVLKDDFNHPHTQINSLGYNVSCADRESSNRALERAVRMSL